MFLDRKNGVVGALVVFHFVEPGVSSGFGGQTRNRIARLDATTGAAEFGFDPNADSGVLSIAVQADGKILAGGQFTSIGGQTRNRIVRLNPDGTLDGAFDPNANSSNWKNSSVKKWNCGTDGDLRR